MIPLLAPIVSLLASKGLDLLSSAIDGGADKAKDYIEEKTGIKLDASKGLSPEQVVKLQEFESTNKIELEKLALENKKEDNRHIEAVINSAKESTKNAQDMNVAIQSSESSSWLAKNAAYMIDFFIITATVVLAIILMYSAVPEENLQIVNIMFGSMLTFVGSIIGYHRGSSHGSQTKETQLQALTRAKQ
jgi:hypothetical protein